MNKPFLTIVMCAATLSAMAQLKVDHDGRGQIANPYISNVQFMPGADFTFRVYNNGSLTQGLRIKDGAKMNILADGDVNISQIIIEPGGTLNITSSNCLLQDVEFPIGANVLIETK